MSTALATLAGKLAERVGMDSVDPQELITTLRQTAFKGDASDAQFIALLIVANQYGLNPWTKEIYAFPDKQNGIVPVVGVDGWSRIINENQQFDGMDFEQDNESCTCRIYRKDRNHPICVTEWMDECRREPFKTREGREITGPWQSHPKRMLRHKAMIQCARLAFGFAGIYDKDEAERIVENTKTWDDDLLPLCSQIFRRDIRASSELTQAEAVKALGFLKQKASEQKVAA
ncbi:phage recombination protein Bet [Escherichia coli]|uniref:phage recombination protein Bet n=1 Tax=Escherichia coli TaxID=562 RepID=UPI00085AB388|nr:phage recombination protein Bet [Escherichia coli]